MPITLDSTRALRGEKRRFTLVTTDHGRWEYLDRMLQSLEDTVGLSFFDRRLGAFDGCTPPEHIANVLTGAWCESERKGLTNNLRRAWGMLTADDEWVFHVESDFVIHDAPLEEMAALLEAFPQVANMVLLRQPWGAHELRYGSVLRAQTYDLTDRGGWLEHHGGFWLNPMVSHSSLLRSLQPGVESDLTAQCRSRGLSFGYYGGLHDEPRCEHIGAEGGMGSVGWLP